MVGSQRPELSHTLFSVSKSFTSTAVGIAIGEGRFSLDDPVVSFFPAETPAQVSPNLAAMKVRHSWPCAPATTRGRSIVP